MSARVSVGVEMRPGATEDEDVFAVTVDLNGTATTLELTGPEAEPILEALSEVSEAVLSQAVRSKLHHGGITLVSGVGEPDRVRCLTCGAEWHPDPIDPGRRCPNAEGGETCTAPSCSTFDCGHEL